jgi:hypothetical protein
MFGWYTLIAYCLAPVNLVVLVWSWCTWQGRVFPTTWHLASSALQRGQPALCTWAALQAGVWCLCMLSARVLHSCHMVNGLS